MMNGTGTPSSQSRMDRMGPPRMMKLKCGAPRSRYVLM